MLVKVKVEGNAKIGRKLGTVGKKVDVSKNTIGTNLMRSQLEGGYCLPFIFLLKSRHDLWEKL